MYKMFFVLEKAVIHSVLFYPFLIIFMQNWSQRTNNMFSCWIALFCYICYIFLEGKKTNIPIFLVAKVLLLAIDF